MAIEDEVFDTIKALAKRCGKIVSCLKDYSSFIVNQVLMSMINEAFYCLLEGVGSSHDIDTGMKLGTNQPMGSLALTDLIGLDTYLSIMRTIHAELGDSKYRPCPLLDLVEMSKLSRSQQQAKHHFFLARCLIEKRLVVLVTFLHNSITLEIDSCMT